MRQTNFLLPMSFNAILNGISLMGLAYFNVLETNFNTEKS